MGKLRWERIPRIRLWVAVMPGHVVAVKRLGPGRWRAQVWIAGERIVTLGVWRWRWQAMRAGAAWWRCYRREGDYVRDEWN